MNTRTNCRRTRCSTTISKLDEMEEEARKVTIPLSYSDELYNLRLHIDLVRRKLKKGLADRV